MLVKKLSLITLLFCASLSSTASSSVHRSSGMEAFTWWREWTAVTQDKTSLYGITEGKTCSTINRYPSDLSTSQIEMITSHHPCTELAFYESFNKYHSVNYDNLYSPTKGAAAIKRHNATLIVGLNRWNVLEGNIELDRYDSKFVRIGGPINDSSHGIRLGNGKLRNSAKIQTRGTVPLSKPGKYVVSVKFKESFLGHYTPKLVGLRTKVYDNNTANKIDDVRYITAEPKTVKNSRWVSVNYMYTIDKPTDIYIEIEPVITTHVDVGPFVGNVLVYRTE